jgi:dihydrofolate reductase
MSINILFYPAMTLDGFIANHEGDSSWVTKEDEELFVKEVQKAGCVIVGNTTFRQYEDIIYPIAGATTFVCTSQPDAQRIASNGVMYVGGEVQEIMRQIEDAGFASAVLSGGGDKWTVR